ncbi:hypothetical protein GW17_00022837 [Ensete ventricosum]|nr:hypothetical protein GW17_00022837 [Ensete ventricosum]
MESSAPREELSSPLLFPDHDDGHGQPLQALTTLPPAAVDGEAHWASGKLECILNDTSIPWLRRVGLASLIEIRLLLCLAAPAVIVYLINYAMSMSTRIFCGHLGNVELAAASLGNTGIQIFAYGIMCRGNAVRAGVRRPQVRDARSIPPAVDGAAHGHRRATCGDLRLVAANPGASGGVAGDRQGGVGLRLRADPADLCIRRQLPDPEVPAGTEHRGAERLHLGRDAGGAPAPELGSGVQGRAGAAGRLAGAEPVLVHHRGGAVRVHRHQPAVPLHVDRVHLASLLRAAGVLPVVHGLRGDAVLGGVVLPDHDSHYRAAEGSGVGP